MKAQASVALEQERLTGVWLLVISTKRQRPFEFPGRLRAS